MWPGLARRDGKKLKKGTREQASPINENRFGLCSQPPVISQLLSCKTNHLLLCSSII